MYGRGSHDKLIDSGDWRENIDLHRHRYMRGGCRARAVVPRLGRRVGRRRRAARARFLAIGSAICGENFAADRRTLASLGLGHLDATPASRRCWLKASR